MLLSMSRLREVVIHFCQNLLVKTLNAYVFQNSSRMKSKYPAKIYTYIFCLLEYDIVENEIYKT